MKRLKFIIFLSLSICATAQCVVNGANLIPNPSFENTTAFCNGADNQIYVDQSPLVDWIGTDLLSTAISTPDIRRINTDMSTCGGSTNVANSTCFTGNKRVGIFVKTSFANGREYVQVVLNSTLIAGRTYCLSADLRSQYGSAGNRLLDTDGFGAHFRNGGVINIQTMNGGQHYIGPGSILNLVPQVQQPAGSIITNACTTFSQTFVAAGGENRVLLGNFRNDAGTSTAGSSTTSYLLIDNVQLYEVPIVLPIELGEFKVNCSENASLLTWTTITERDNDYFILEKSCDGFNYEPIAKIEGAGNSTQILNYNYEDYNPCSSYSYYRLSQTDFNGERTVFHTISSQCNKQDVVVYPNPSNSTFILKNFNSQISDLIIYDATGKMVENFHDKILKINDEIEIDVKDLSAGIYFISFKKINSETSFIKLIKL